MTWLAKRRVRREWARQWDEAMALTRASVLESLIRSGQVRVRRIGPVFVRGFGWL